MLLGGDFRSGRGGSLATQNPATAETLAELSTADRADVDEAVHAARTAYSDTWSTISGAHRAKYLFRIARLLQERARELAVLETLDTGIPITQTRDTYLPAVAAHFFHYAGWADKLGYAGFGPAPAPVGVAGQVISGHSPLLTLAWRVAPALACGNTVVLKPAATTPLSALVFAGVCQQAGLPAGVLNVLPGGDDVGAELVAHPRVDALAFNGHTEIGKEVQRSLAGSGKRLALELEGNAPDIVFEDAALDQAVDGVVRGSLAQHGESRRTGSRVLVQESIAEQFHDRLRERLATLRMGDPLDANTDVGPVHSAAQLARVTELVGNAEREGAACWNAEGELPDRGFFFRPTVCAEVDQAMRIAREETPGPVLAVQTFRTPDEAVGKANNTPAGLSTAVWTEKAARMLWATRKVRAGVVWANTSTRFDPTAAFGGQRESGFGRCGGTAGLEAYLDV